MKSVPANYIITQWEKTRQVTDVTSLSQHLTLFGGCVAAAARMSNMVQGVRQEPLAVM